MESTTTTISTTFVGNSNCSGTSDPLGRLQKNSDHESGYYEDGSDVEERRRVVAQSGGSSSQWSSCTSLLPRQQGNNDLYCAQPLFTNLFSSQPICQSSFPVYAPSCHRNAPYIDYSAYLANGFYRQAALSQYYPATHRYQPHVIPFARCREQSAPQPELAPQYTSLSFSEQNAPQQKDLLGTSNSVELLANFDNVLRDIAARLPPASAPRATEYLPASLAAINSLRDFSSFLTFPPLSLAPVISCRQDSLVPSSSDSSTYPDTVSTGRSSPDSLLSEATTDPLIHSGNSPTNSDSSVYFLPFPSANPVTLLNNPEQDSVPADERSTVKRRNLSDIEVITIPDDSPVYLNNPEEDSVPADQRPRVKRRKLSKIEVITIPDDSPVSSQQNPVAKDDAHDIPDWVRSPKSPPGLSASAKLPFHAPESELATCSNVLPVFSVTAPPEPVAENRTAWLRSLESPLDLSAKFPLVGAPKEKFSHEQNVDKPLFRPWLSSPEGKPPFDPPKTMQVNKEPNKYEIERGFVLGLLSDKSDSSSEIPIEDDTPHQFSPIRRFKQRTTDRLRRMDACRRRLRMEDHESDQMNDF